MENEVVTIENTKGLIPVKNLNVVEFFSNREKVDAILEEARKAAFDFEADAETPKGRKKVISQARLVASSKTLLDGLGKDWLATIKAKIKPMDGNRKYMREEFDKLRDEVRDPVTKIEEAEKAQAEVERVAKELAEAHDEALAENAMVDRQREIERKEAELAKQEQERLAKEKADREEKERKEREERIAREAEEKAKREAEEKACQERERIENEKREAEEREQRAKIEAEVAEKRRKEAEEQAERDRVAALKAQEDAIKRAEEEKRAAIKAAEEKARLEAEKREQERLQKEAEAEAERKRVAADKAHRKEVNNAALACFEQNGIDAETGKQIITLIASGQIDYITVNY